MQKCYQSELENIITLEMGKTIRFYLHHQVMSDTMTPSSKEKHIVLPKHIDRELPTWCTTICL